MADWNEMTLFEAYNAIEEQKKKVDNAAYWDYTKKAAVMDKYEKLLNAINYLFENKRYFIDYNFMTSELIKIGQKDE
jgi:hypothetical protein